MVVLYSFMGAWNAHSVEGLMQCMTPACSYYAAAGAEASGAVFNGAEDVANAFAAIFQTFPDAQWKNPKYVLEADEACVSWRFHGTHAETGQKVVTDGVDLLTFHRTLIRTKNTFRKTVVAS